MDQIRGQVQHHLSYHRGRFLTHYMPKLYRIRPERLSRTLTIKGGDGWVELGCTSSAAGANSSPCHAGVTDFAKTRLLLTNGALRKKRHSPLKIGFHHIFRGAGEGTSNPSRLLSEFPWESLLYGENRVFRFSTVFQN